MHEPMGAAHLIADKLALIQKTLEAQNAILRRLAEAAEDEKQDADAES